MFDKGKNFFLEGNTSFTDRQKNVFGQLDMMSSQKPENRMSEEEVEFQSRKVTVDTSKNKVKHFRGKESIFKKPDLPQKRSTTLNIPDFVKNPHKWKKYKLDVDESSDQSNRNVAMAFLKEMLDRKAKMEVDEPKNEKIKFNKNFKNDGKETARVDEDDKPSFINGKLTMPEYVIGQKIKKPKKDGKRKVIAGSSKVKLDHLDEEDDII